MFVEDGIVRVMRKFARKMVEYVDELPPELVAEARTELEKAGAQSVVFPNCREEDTLGDLMGWEVMVFIGRTTCTFMINPEHRHMLIETKTFSDEDIA